MRRHSRIDGLEDFGDFYEATYDRAYRVAFAIVRDSGTAADVTHDAYVAAFRNRSRYRGDAPPVHWLLRIVVNRALDVATRRTRVRWSPLTLDAGTPTPSPEEAAMRRDAIDALLAPLDPRQRAVLVLRHVEGLDYGAIAAVLGTTRGNVGVILTRALAKLRAVDANAADQRRHRHDG
jgi:RNA polymerase sigma-70 factor, ECF subfamily